MDAAFAAANEKPAFITTFEKENLTKANSFLPERAPVAAKAVIKHRVTAKECK
jgi:hypothetical protein